MELLGHLQYFTIGAMYTIIGYVVIIGVHREWREFNDVTLWIAAVLWPLVLTVFLWYIAFSRANFLRRK